MFSRVLVPLGRAGARQLARRLEQRAGPTKLTRTLRRVSTPLGRTPPATDRASRRRGRLTTGRDT